MTLRGFFLAFVLGLVVGLWVVEHVAPPKKRLGVTVECVPPAVRI